MANILPICFIILDLVQAPSRARQRVPLGVPSPHPNTFLALHSISRLSVKKVKIVKKSVLCYIRNLRKVTFWAFFTQNCSYTGRFPKGLNVSKFQKHTRLSGKKVNKVPCIIEAIWGKYLRNFQKKSLFWHFWSKNTLDYPAKSQYCSILS